MILVSVIDGRPGIAQEVAARLFEPFVTSKQRGMGVGPSISRTMIETRGGRIWFASNPDGEQISASRLRQPPQRRSKMLGDAAVHVID
jgi:two-component system sensor kinase FixL